MEMTVLVAEELVTIPHDPLAKRPGRDRGPALWPIIGAGSWSAPAQKRSSQNTSTGETGRGRDTEKTNEEV